MEKIDWDSAPEGYPIWIQGCDKHFFSGWYRELSDRYQSQRGTYYLKRDSCFFTAHTRPSPSWSGEGLPPVGVVCEYNARNNSGIGKELWCEVVIKYLSDWVIVFECTKAPVGHEESVGVELFGDISSGLANRFRPIRTPEQIAADEREAAILQMLKDAGRPDTAKTRDQAQLLYDAGWRKP